MRILRTLLVLIVVATIAWWFLFRGSSGASSLSPEEFVAHGDPSGLILDVRTAREYSVGHLDGAINVNVFDGNFRERVDGYDRDAPVYLYCGSGQRSGRATAILTEMGFQEAYNVGGYGALKAAGTPVVEP